MNDFYGDWDEFEREVATFADRMERNMERATRRNAEHAVKAMKEHIIEQKGDVKLSNLAPRTRRRKARLGKDKALIMTGQLVQAFTHRMLSPTSAVVGIKRYGKGSFNIAKHHEDRFHFVRDAVEGVREDIVERWTDAFEDTVKGH